MEMEKTPEPTDDLESLSKEELIERYKQVVGKDPTFRGFDEATLREGICNPEAELVRLAAIDRESDKEDLSSPYKRG